MMYEYIIFKTENPHFTYAECVFRVILIIKRIYRSAFFNRRSVFYVS